MHRELPALGLLCPTSLTRRTRIGSLRTRYAADERDEIAPPQPAPFRVSHHNFNL
jgi:hypothetical protein